ncbi:hypothetical protein TM1040_1608 [Ruegeria sp. TM1040]|uniref:DUF4376 domain-containing protein n=1 Tax=Ruegeria sp. (strain TM1040) TaxID=292414 RepID=UPI000046239D|nr:DUF4376 domain-containing protein [Ruegeria sp. TM1040]ABF64341.1 hypothetical protein TM1040_1608 [Ruegeria sp. TM1040]
MKYAIIENGVVVNIAKADAPLAYNWVGAGGARIGDLWDGQAFTPPAPPPPTTDDVNAERARRLVAGTTVTVTGHGPVALSGRDEDTRNLQGLAFAAQLRLSQGDTTHQTTFRDAENADHVLTPAQVLEMWSLGSAWIEQVYAASWALKDTQGGIPADYANDGYWPQ